MFKKKLLACALALLCSFSMVACNTDGNEKEETGESGQTSVTSQTITIKEEDEPVTTIIDGEKTDYRIVYSSTADDWAYITAQYISDRILEATGVALKVGTDASASSDYEIVIGETNRSEELGFDAETHDWERYPVHIGLYGNKLLFTASKNIDIYEKLSFAMDKWLEEAEPGKLGVNEKNCRQMMRAVGSVNDNVITMMMQNVCTWGDTPNTRTERFERVYEEFRYYDADIIGVSEAIPQWITYLDGVMLPDGYTRLGGKKLLEVDGDWNNIYYKTDKFNVIEWDTFWYGETPDVPGTTVTETAGKKVATWALFEVINTGKRFVVLNTHLQAYQGTANDAIRAAQIAQFTSFLEQYMDEYPVYVMGDMNITEQMTIYQTVLQTFYDSRDIAVANISGELDTYNAYGERTADGDYIFTGKGSNQEILWYKVINEKQFGSYKLAANEWISDHYGVCVQTRIS